ncbi:MAG: hypothetical protein QOF78_2564 [Phycisphaerales bacterium]|nr:hypothetical protein [Phycisphaerales bacterium]
MCSRSFEYLGMTSFVATLRRKKPLRMQADR